MKCISYFEAIWKSEIKVLQQEMKLLLLDYISYKGHQNFNKIHVDALLTLGHELILVGRRGQFDNIEANDNISKLEMPECFFKEYPMPTVSFRLQGIAAFLWLKTKIIWSDYDAVIILTYDILSLFVFHINQRTFLINHNNVPQLWSKVKLAFTKNLPKNYIHIALNQEMEQRLKELLPERKVYHIPHGICPPAKDILRPNFIKEGARFIFCPVNRNYEVTFVKRIFEDKELSTFLGQRGYKLYVKENIGIDGALENIESIPSNLGYAEYNYMIQNAMAVLLPYGSQFKYRCSGIFFECVARQTPVICTNLDAMKIYESDVDMRMFSDTKELIDAIGYYSEHKVRVTDLSVFNPKEYWYSVLEGMKIS